MDNPTVRKYDVAEEILKQHLSRNDPNAKELISCIHALYLAFFDLDETQKDSNVELYRQLTSEATVLAYDVAEERLKCLLSSNNPDRNILLSCVEDLKSSFTLLNESQKDKNAILYTQLIEETKNL